MAEPTTTPPTPVRRAVALHPTPSRSTSASLKTPMQPSQPPSSAKKEHKRVASTGKDREELPIEVEKLN